MKKVIGLVLISMSLNVWATNKASEPVKTDENNVMARLTEQILNTINKSAIDLNINGISIDSQAAEGKQVRMDDVQLSGMVSFSGNWEVDLVEADENKDSSQMQKVYPKLIIDSNNLHLAIDAKMQGDTQTIALRFFSHFDKTKQLWVPRPLTFKASNQMNKDLLTIRLFSLQMDKKLNKQNPNQSDINGICVSEKLLLDLATGKSKVQPVDCKFSGTMTDKGYKLNFRYANK